MVFVGVDTSQHPLTTNDYTPLANAGAASNWMNPVFNHSQGAAAMKLRDVLINSSQSKHLKQHSQFRATRRMSGV